MNFVPKLSLQNIACVKTVSALRIQDDINYSVTYRRYRPPQRRVIGERILEKLIKLELPKFLERKIFTVAKHMTNNALFWIDKHLWLVQIFQKIFECKIEYLCFTSDGVVDNKKTVEMIVTNEDLDIKERYVLACSYCLESDIRKLWEKLSTAEKEYLDKKMKQPSVYSPWYDSGRHSYYWTFRDEMMPGRPSKTLWKLPFERAENKEAAEYTLQKLTPSEREQSMITKIRRIESRGYFSRWHEIFFFLLTQLSEEKQIEICQTFPFVVLALLLHWPRPYLFLRTALRLWEFLPSDEYGKLSKMIIHEIFEDNNSDYKELFREFWLQSPMTHKKYVYDKCESRMNNVLKIEDGNKNKHLGKDIKHQYILSLIENDEWKALERLFSRIYPWQISLFENRIRDF